MPAGSHRVFQHAFKLLQLEFRLKLNKSCFVWGEAHSVHHFRPPLFMPGELILMEIQTRERGLILTTEKLISTFASEHKSAVPTSTDKWLLHTHTAHGTTNSAAFSFPTSPYNGLSPHISIVTLWPQSKLHLGITLHKHTMWRAVLSERNQ